MNRDNSLYINGNWRSSAEREVFAVANPFSLSTVGHAIRGSADDVESAVAAARAAFDSGPWGRMNGAERAEVMERFATEIEARAAELSRLVTDEIGQPIGLSSFMSATGPAMNLRYHATLARGLAEEQERAAYFSAGHNLIRREAVGVVGIIVPWNYPQALLMAKLAPALATGCTVVIKPAEESPLDALLLADAAHAAGVPAGVINVVTGGRLTGEYLVQSDGVDKIGFTGSTEAGRAIASACGAKIRPVTLELGGKSAAVVLDDADFDTVIASLSVSSFMNSGQTCFLLSRILVPDNRAAEFLDGIVAAAESQRLGDPLDATTQLGPLVSARIRDRVESFIGIARSEGARLATGGGRPSGLGDGYFVEPTVFSGVTPDSTLAQEEVFGPVLAVLTYRSDAEAVQLANDSKYGLGGAVYSSDPDRALGVARAMKTGTVGINSYTPDLAAPFGGYKDSGLGRENGPEGLEGYLSTKSIYLQH